MKLTKQDIDFALSDSEDIWTFGNNVLYNLCREYPRHDSKSIVVAKIWLIGRSYSASIERRKPTSIHGLVDNDGFYENVVASALMESSLDQQIQSIRRYTSPSRDSIPLILDLHMYLMGIFKAITNLDKRSLASKYLHFHLPHLFYLYDSRACTGLRKRLPRYRSKNEFSGKYDKNYKDFTLKLLSLQEEIESSFGKHLFPRQLDRLLVRVKVDK
jgi:hypothetical protein